MWYNNTAKYLIEKQQNFFIDNKIFTSILAHEVKFLKKRENT